MSSSTRIRDPFESPTSEEVGHPSSSSGLCAGELQLSAITIAGRDAGCTLIRQSLGDQHSVSVTIEPIAVLHRVGIRLSNPLNAAEGHEQSEQRASGKMKIG